MNPEAMLSWQYNGAAPWREIKQWCLDHFGVFDSNGSETIYFARDEDYTMFVLRWS